MVSRLVEVEVPPTPLERLAPYVLPDREIRLAEQAVATRALLAGRSVVNVNSTAVGGGVAELVHSAVAYSGGAGLDVRWLVIHGDALFFEITKRIHNRLHGDAGDGGTLGDSERVHYETVLAANAEELKAVIRDGDVVILHDPQTVGLARVLKEI
ncbi:MAG: glycosyl transferase family 1, partial [Dehalococcoidia bacterium]|nr:glycosyl transferase family 1 [Dehalococcoidia bacterium]